MQLKKHERITFELRLASSSLADIDRALGRCQSTVTIVSKGYGRSERIQKEIAAMLGASPKKTWPKRYRMKETPKDVKAAELEKVRPR